MRALSVPCLNWLFTLDTVLCTSVLGRTRFNPTNIERASTKYWGRGGDGGWCGISSSDVSFYKAFTLTKCFQRALQTFSQIAGETGVSAVSCPFKPSEVSA